MFDPNSSSMASCSCSCSSATKGLCFQWFECNSWVQCQLQVYNPTFSWIQQWFSSLVWRAQDFTRWICCKWLWSLEAHREADPHCFAKGSPQLGSWPRGRVVKSKVFLDLSSPSVTPNTHPQFRNFLLKMPHSSLPPFSTDAKHSLKLISGVPQLLPRAMIDHISTTTTTPEEEQDQRTPSHKLVHILVSSSRSKSTTAVRRRSLTASTGFSGVGTWFGRQGEALVWWRVWKQRSDHCWQSEEFTESSWEGLGVAKKDGNYLKSTISKQTKGNVKSTVSCTTYSRRTHCIISSSLFLPRMWTCRTANLKCILLTQAVEICRLLTPTWNLLRQSSAPP